MTDAASVCPMVFGLPASRPCNIYICAAAAARAVHCWPVIISRQGTPANRARPHLLRPLCSRRLLCSLFLSLELCYIFDGFGGLSGHMAAPVALKPGVRVHGSCQATFRGLTSAFQRLSVGSTPSRRSGLVVEGGNLLPSSEKQGPVAGSTKFQTTCNLQLDQS